MLAELRIRQFAIIDELQLAFAPGFNVLTGETGAGKSIILDAVMLILGGRADSSFIRAGQEKAQVEATFRLNEKTQALLAPLIEAQGLENDEGDNIVTLAREMRTTGRNICRVNGRTVSLSILKQVGEMVIDIHGQGEHLSLLRPKSHLPLLDAYARVEKQQKEVAAAVRLLRRVRGERQKLQQDARMLAQRQDMLAFQVEEIEAAQLEVGEDEELRSERQRLANAEQLMRQTALAHALLLGADDETPAVLDMLSEVEGALLTLSRLDDSQGGMLERLQGLISELNEVAGDVEDYRDGLEFNPSRLSEVEERLELIHRLGRKYGDSIESILAFGEAAAAELDTLTHSEERLETLAKEDDKLCRQIGKLALALSEGRKKAAAELGVAVEAELGDLQMSGARFEVSFETMGAEDGVYVGDERLACETTGIDLVEFLISTNPGEPLKPMAKVASGGETARLMLALKTALAQVDVTPTLIFDEIDQGIGGRIGAVVGEKLWGLTAVGEHQVIVVTHLPQLAGFGDKHFHVRKGLSEGRTTTQVITLDRDGRVSEMGAMLGTEEALARQGAESILEQVAAVKKAAVVPATAV
ncbi:MAG TPA: DNA repair protein RecN [Anaerolineae bacterium]|nr:DNA repair protein RecN [Anaerolineae bacterium]